MDAPQTSGNTSGPPTRPQGRRPRGGRPPRGRGGRHRGSLQTQGNNETAPMTSETPSTPPALNTGPPNQEALAGNTTNARGRRGSRALGSRASRRGGGGLRGQNTMMTAQRPFGGHLTSTPAAGASGAVGPAVLSADAPVFVPGQPAVTESNKKANQNTPKPVRRASKSVAEDLPTRIHEDINNSQYECVICTNEVLRNSRIWSCTICWTVTHMSCVRKWFSNRTKTPDEQQLSWRCPGCNSSMNDEPATYHCWCGKEINPKSIAGLSPHGCGQTCSKPRGTCPHPCPLECHAGPCPPCLLMGPSQSCFCGKHTSTKRCGETDYTQGWSCHETCGDLLACGEHECQRECHSGLCGSCEVPVASSCYCGRESKEIPCDERGDKLESYDYGQLRGKTLVSDEVELPESWFWGSFDCGRSCGRFFDCDKHRCEKACHPQDESPAHCPLSPDIVTHCPCGKTVLSEIIPQPRNSCEDPIPHCDRVCNKSLACGHFCKETCHTGSCAPCTQIMELVCRCGRTTSATVCHQGDVQRPECMRVCRAQLNCGRHEHGEHCCPGEKKAMERVSAKRKNKVSNVTNEEFEAEHICIRVCGRDLKCGKHQCQQMCHRGPCRSCPEAVFEEISCHCGRTVLQPPQPCGTQPPECRFECARPRPCGHPQVSHNCHPDDKSCPKCPFLVEKPCICSKKSLKNQPCWFEQPRCGLACNKKLKCGTHVCGKLCHRVGECEDTDVSGSRCKQPCGKTRNCGHLCIEQCHAPYPCKEDKPCQAKTFVTCDCQNRKQEVRCMATKSDSSPQRPVLKCNDECLRLQRNSRLADALNINPEVHTDDHVPYSDTTLKLYRENPQWAQIYEREYRVFAGDKDEKVMRLKPMKSHQRAFLHSLAEDFGLDSESADPEPHRHVCLFKTPRFVSAPMKTLAQCVKIQAAVQKQDSLAQTSTWGGGNTSSNQPYNALILSEPQFGLTTKELDSALKKEYSAHPTLKFHTSFLPSDQVLIKASGSWTAQALESSLSSLKPALSQTVKRLGLAKEVSLCHADDSLNVLRQEEASQAKGEGGWSAVVGRSAARPKAVPAARAPPVSLRSNFVALRKEPKKKIEEEIVEEDWEAAAEKLDGE
ncbi:hypothetical protein F4809DRAFT_591093 [Biscogniauxia mediterranea]|nr:hypothetical protein F4809DRAFT_591093 [Biscogniauxia mediterranea]